MASNSSSRPYTSQNPTSSGTPSPHMNYTDRAGKGAVSEEDQPRGRVGTSLEVQNSEHRRGDGCTWFMTSGLASRGSHRFTMATGAPEEGKAELSASGGGVGAGGGDFARLRPMFLRCGESGVFGFGLWPSVRFGC
jgi:hypothetical protein